VLRGWSEIAEKTASGDSSVLAFIKMAKAFTDESGKIYVRFSDTFSKSIVDTPKTREALRAASCIVLRRNISENDIIFGLFEGNEDSISDLDELNID
jgi:hypothetical protein